MADETTANPPVVTELIPSVEGKVSGVASANAPIIFFDGVPTMGHFNGVVHFSFAALRFMPGDNRVVADSVMVAHLRTNMLGLRALKEAIEKIELLAQPTASGEKN